jgi:hypothetical protein
LFFLLAEEKDLQFAFFLPAFFLAFDFAMRLQTLGVA